MSWMQKLYETHGTLAQLSFVNSESASVPESHSTARAHIEITLDRDGAFSRARVIDKAEATTVIPCTEASAARTGSRPVPHPLCDGLQYVAADFRKYGGVVTSGFAKEDDQPRKDYLEQLHKWVAAAPHPKTVLIYKYLEVGAVIEDLVRQRVLPLDADGKIASSKTPETAEWPLWAVLPAGQSADKAVVRWRVEIPGNLASGVWEDQSLLDNWSAYYPATIETKGLCMVNGDMVALSSLHPAKLRHAGDKAKLISSNDSSGFVFRGRFTDSGGTQACGVGYEVTQKAHSTLRWLIARQGHSNDTQVFVSWAVSGKPIPPPIEDSHDWLDEPIDMDDAPAQAEPDNTRDLGQSFALRLNKYIAGYAAKLAPTECIVVMGVDSATPGRMSIIYYRELLGSEFLGRLKKWHADMAWPQRVSAKQKDKDKKKGAPVAPWRPCAPTPKAIAEAAYGRRLDDKLKRATVERLVPCIVDGREPPADLVEGCVRRAANRPGFKEHWEWEQALGVACAMYKGRHARHAKAEQRRTYDMALELERTSRDYLYGRLLAVAERIEEMALYVAGEDRPTTAARLMQRFADHPCSTWRSIELALQPYMQRLRASRGGFLHNMNALLDDIVHSFQGDDFTSGRGLTGEFLLGYHCQRQVWKKDKSNAAETEGVE